MSSFWGKLIRVTPKFSGTPEQRKANELSHRWHTVHLIDRFREVTDPELKVTECSRCGVLANHGAASYECGAAPDEKPLSEWITERAPTPKR
mgnify:FL=1|jgi:hypothetical protein|tara:strand:+ start:330 stop:605 length:276 start_codon:yes stop_codon:yes gene_type:complete